MERECRRRRGDAWPCLKMKDRGQKQINQTCQLFLFFSCKEQEFLSFIFLIRLNYKYLLIHDHTLWFYLQCLKEAGCGTCTGLLKIFLPQWQQMAFNTAWAWRQEDTRRATKMPRTQECTSCGLPRRMSTSGEHLVLYVPTVTTIVVPLCGDRAGIPTLSKHHDQLKQHGNYAK